MSLTDPHRPAFHLVGDPWLNDPIPFFHEGDWHLFYQHNPAKAFWGDMCWGHAVSRDLVRWQRLPNALLPTPGGYDQRGCWSGSILNARGGFHLFYTAIPQLQPELRQVQALATSQDLIHWDKYAGNPLIHGKPGVAGTCFRAPCVFEEGGGYTMVVGSEKKDGSGGLALRYRSDDLLRWTYTGVLCEGRIGQSGLDFECPDFFQLGRDDGRETRVRERGDDRGAGPSGATPEPSGDRPWCLLTSRHRQWAHLGSYRDGRFEAASVLPIEGPSFYAGKTAADGTGRRLLWGWVIEPTAGPNLPEDPAIVARGWAGVMSLPREVSIDAEGRLAQHPPAELTALRRSRKVIPSFECEGLTFLEGVRGDRLEVRLKLDLLHATAAGLAVRVSPDAKQKTLTAYDRTGRVLDTVPCFTDPYAPVELVVFLDRSVVEAFCGGAASTQRCFPADPARADRVAIWSDGPVRVLECEVWELALPGT